MKKVRPVVARNAKELVKVLGLAPAEGIGFCRNERSAKSDPKELRARGEFRISPRQRR
jgi:hypothetical protein